MPAVPGAGPRAHGAWERAPAPALPLCLHVTFPLQRKWCRGEVPAGTGHHVIGLQPSLGRAGGNPEHSGESSPQTLFPNGIVGMERLPLHPPCSPVASLPGLASSSLSCMAPRQSCPGEPAEVMLLGVVSTQELASGQQRGWSQCGQGAVRLPLLSQRHSRGVAGAH